MAEKLDSTPGNPEAEIMLVSNTESKHWEIVQAVRDLHRQGYDTQTACEKLGINRATYYRAMQSRFVQEQRLNEIQAMREASTTIIERNWTRILNNMAHIARDGDNKEAVQAARFVREVMKDLERDADELAQDQKDSAMAHFAEQMKNAPGKKTFRAKRTRTRGNSQVTEEVEVEIPDVSAGNPYP